MESIREVVDGAREGMAFFQQLARCMGARNDTVSYFTPIGFPVDNSYFKKLKTELKIYLYDKKAESEAKRTKMVLRKDNFKAVDTKSCASAVAPNIIHSLDASHLCETVLACLTDRNQVTDFILIHDSFGTHAANTDTLFKLVRQTFVNQYAERCIYTDIKQQLIDHYKLNDEEIAELPDVPAKGDLKLEDVISSDYCFA
jgi:DNA-directed RNA polymerase